MPRRVKVPRRLSLKNEETDIENKTSFVAGHEDEIEILNRWLATVLNYISDEDVEGIDIEYILDQTEGLREWWEHYQETNRKQIEEEIKQSLGELSIKELERIREKIMEKEKLTEVSLI